MDLSPVVVPGKQLVTPAIAGEVPFQLSPDLRCPQASTGSFGDERREQRRFRSWYVRQ